MEHFSKKMNELRNVMTQFKLYLLFLIILFSTGNILAVQNKKNEKTKKAQPKITFILCFPLIQ